MGLYPVEYWPLFPITFYFKRFNLQWKKHDLHNNRNKTLQDKNRCHALSKETLIYRVAIMSEKMVGSWHSTFLHCSEIRTPSDEQWLIYVPFSSYFVLSSHFVVSTNSTCPFLSFHVPHLILCSQSKPREDKAGTGRKAQKEVRIHEILTVLSFLLSKPQRRCPFLTPNYPSSWNSILFVPPLGTDLPPTC